MAAIATTRSLGCLLHRNNMDSAARIIFHPTISFIACGFIWLLAFAILLILISFLSVTFWLNTLFACNSVVLSSPPRWTTISSSR